MKFERGPEFEFTADWFAEVAQDNWDTLLPAIRPQKFLEVGSHEGRSACYLIEKLANDADIEIHCVDVWRYSEVENRFDRNIATAISMVKNSVKLKKHKGRSDVMLSKMIHSGKTNYFDFIYIDGSHWATDVIFDAVAAFRLCRVGGVIAFDDYLWHDPSSSQKDILRGPKPAIDAFTSLYWQKVSFISAPLYQIYVKKVAN